MFDAGSTGFMLVCAMLVLLMSPAGVLLRGFEPPQERREHDDHVVCGDRHRRRHMDGVRLVVRLRRRRLDSVLRGLRSDRPARTCGRHRERGARSAESRRVSHDGRRGVSVGVLHDHHGHHHGRGGRSREVRRGVRVRGRMDRRGVPAARPHGVGRRGESRGEA